MCVFKNEPKTKRRQSIDNLETLLHALCCIMDTRQAAESNKFLQVESEFWMEATAILHINQLCVTAQEIKNNPVGEIVYDEKNIVYPS